MWLAPPRARAWATELILADIATLEKAIPRLEKEAKRDKASVAKLETARKVLEGLNEGHRARTLGLSDDEQAAIYELHLLTMKPMLYIANVDEGAVDVELPEPVRGYALENHRSERECDKALADRIETILRIAAANGAETLVVGAFGCGRNGYEPAQVIELFRVWIAEHPGSIARIVFAVPRLHADAFRAVFGAAEPERPVAAPVAAEDDSCGEDEDWRDVELPEGITLR